MSVWRWRCCWRRAWVFFLVKYFLDGGSWASSAFNRHLYNSSGQLASGTVLDRDGDVLSEVVDGQRTYYDNATVRKATLHAVGDLQGNIGTGALNAFADKLTGLQPAERRLRRPAGERPVSDH